MTYTVRFAHLAELPPLTPGRVLQRGHPIGYMGSTGQSSGAHVHMDIAEGCQKHRYSLADLAAGRPKAVPVELLRFLNDRLFGIYPLVTTGFDDPDYLGLYKKRHMGLDIVPEDRKSMAKAHYTIKWPLDVPGSIMAIYDNDPGYGNAVLIAYEA